jgi:hypothetical protein
MNQPLEKTEVVSARFTGNEGNVRKEQHLQTNEK